MKEYFVSLLSLMLKLGWAVPLVLSSYLFFSWAPYCLKSDMMCSFPGDKIAVNLAITSAVWLVVSLLTIPLIQKFQIRKD